MFGAYVALCFSFGPAALPSAKCAGYAPVPAVTISTQILTPWFDPKPGSLWRLAPVWLKASTW